MRKLLLALIGIVLLGSSGVILLVSRTIPTNEPSAPTPSKLECVEDGTPRGLVGCIRNEDIQWQLIGDGLEPQLSGATAKLQKASENIEPALLEALWDNNKFVAAYVLLVRRASYMPVFVGGSRSWYGLQVHFVADGQVAYEGNDLAKLHEYWKKKLQH